MTPPPAPSSPEVTAASQPQPNRRRVFRICAWCRRIGLDAAAWGSERRRDRDTGELVSHGICPECANSICRRLK